MQVSSEAESFARRQVVSSSKCNGSRALGSNKRYVMAELRWNAWQKPWNLEDIGGKNFRIFRVLPVLPIGPESNHQSGTSLGHIIGPFCRRFQVALRSTCPWKRNFQDGCIVNRGCQRSCEKSQVARDSSSYWSYWKAWQFQIRLVTKGVHDIAIYFVWGCQNAAWPLPGLTEWKASSLSTINRDSFLGVIR